MMQTKIKPAKHFSMPLMKQNIKTNWLLMIVICFVLCLTTAVISFSMKMLGGESMTAGEKKEAQAELYTHLFAIVGYNEMTGSNLSIDDFMSAQDKSAYDAVFEVMNRQSQDVVFSTERLSNSIEILKDEDGLITTHVEQFEYVYALNEQKGVFSNKELTLEDMMETMLTSMGLPTDQVMKMAEMDKTAMLNMMYFTTMALLPLFLYIVIVGNSLIVNQVDSGSLAYVLATPTKRSAVANTQAIFLIVSTLIICVVGCIARCVTMSMFVGNAQIKMNIVLFFGMYLLTQAVGGICYMGSCIFTRSRKATAFGGGLTVWFFIAALLSIFGAKDMVNMGMGVDELGIFNKLTLVGLFDTNALTTVGTSNVDYSFVWKLAVLALIAIVTYVVGNIRFRKKDLPL